MDKTVNTNRKSREAFRAWAASAKGQRFVRIGQDISTSLFFFFAVFALTLAFGGGALLALALGVVGAAAYVATRLLIKRAIADPMGTPSKAPKARKGPNGIKRTPASQAVATPEAPTLPVPAPRKLVPADSKAPFVTDSGSEGSTGTSTATAVLDEPTPTAPGSKASVAPPRKRMPMKGSARK